MKTGVIIAAQATYDCGKTTALRGIWLGLKKSGAREVFGPDFYDQGADKPKDVEAILEYQCVRIGLSSRGDPGIDQAGILDKFIKNDCRIILCACRTKGYTKNPISALKESWEIRYIPVADYGYISIDRVWNELMMAIRVMKFIRI